MTKKDLLWALFDIGLALVAVSLGFVILAIFPLQNGEEVSVRKNDWMPVSIWCKQGYLYQYKFVEDNGRAKYSKVPIGRYKFAYHEKMPVILTCPG